MGYCTMPYRIMHVPPNQKGAQTYKRLLVLNVCQRSLVFLLYLFGAFKLNTVMLVVNICVLSGDNQVTAV